MVRSEHLQMATRLRNEAEKIRRHQTSNFFEQTYACLRHGELSSEREDERSGLCPLLRNVPQEYEREAFPCQHTSEEVRALATQKHDLAAEYAAWLLRTAEELEAAATCPRRKGDSA